MGFYWLGKRRMRGKNGFLKVSFRNEFLTSWKFNFDAR